ncbi:MAG: PfkB family carbohydrate kinase [Thermoproteota archaeon]|nr:hypothetical protein [Candidatus Bathyarchaeota archaeon]
MKSVVVIGTAGKDEHIRVRALRDLPAPFTKFVKKTLPFSKIEEYYGTGWNMERVYEELRRHMTLPVRYSYGGRAPHVAYGLALLRGKVSLITTFGSDYDYPYPGFFGGGYVSHLRDSGVSFNICEVHLQDENKEKVPQEILDKEVWVVKNRTTSTIVCVKDEEGNDFYYIDDIGGAGKVEFWRPVPKKPLANADIVFVTSSETTFMKEAISIAHTYNKIVVLDVGSYGVTKEYLREVVPKTDILLGNHSELNQVLDAFNLHGFEEILQIDPDKPRAVVLEDKVLGVIRFFERGKTECRIGPISISKTGSSVGACDGMATGILSGLQRDLPLLEACKIGLLEASSIWEVEGVQEGMLRREGVLSRYVTNFGYEGFDLIQKSY